MLEQMSVTLELPPERIAKSIIDVAKNTHSDSQIVRISGIAPTLASKRRKWTKNFPEFVTRKNCFFWVIVKSTRKPIWVKANLTSTVMVMKNLVRILWILYLNSWNWWKSKYWYWCFFNSLNFEWEIWNWYWNWW